MISAKKIAIHASEAVVTNLDRRTRTQKIPAADETIISNLNHRSINIPIVDVQPGAFADHGVMADAHLLPSEDLHALINMRGLANMRTSPGRRLTAHRAAAHPRPAGAKK